jgi:RNA polymerase sigma factor (sigma-70 family)
MGKIFFQLFSTFVRKQGLLYRSFPKGGGNLNDSENQKFLNILYLENRVSLALFIGSKIYSNDYNDVEDCLQEVFLIVIRKSRTDDIANHPNLKGWLFAVAKNVAAKFNAAYMKNKSFLTVPVELTNHLSGEDFTEQVLENIVYSNIDREKLIGDMMSELTANEREIFELRLQKLTNKEIAEMLNKSESTVKSTYSRLKPKLRQIISKEAN